MNEVISIIDKDLPLISNLSNVSAALKMVLKDINWVGFYLVGDNNLYLGPFQGEVACTIIPFNKGICGLSYREKKTIIVPNVLERKEHIACSSKTRSEIVTPIIKDDMVVALIDVDSESFSRFKEEDKILLEKVAEELKNIF